MAEHLPILVVGLPHMLREIVEAALADVPHVTLVEAAPAVLVAELRRGWCGLVIADGGALSTAEVAATLREFPALRILAIDGDGRTAALHELRPHREPLGEASAERIVEVVREHAIVAVAT